MKKTLLLLFGVVIAGVALAQTEPVVQPQGAAITWEKSIHDFGDIVTGDKVEYTYHFTNSGNEPLIITNVTVTCGCTIPKGWPRDPIGVGNSGQVTIAFDSHNKLGKLTKVITIISNAVNADGSQIIFTVNVQEKKAAQ